MNDKIQKAPMVPPFVRFVCSAVPMVFDDSLSYYEALCALWKWLQDDVVNVINNNATVTEDYIQLTNEMKEYMDNYFDNLDVQEEINNKLDQMAEDGTLEEIMAHYLEAITVWSFDTVADMKASTNLVDGSYAKTAGFYSINDGGGSIYYITSTGDANEKDVIAVGSLYANLVVDGNEVNVKQFGAKGDGSTDDTASLQVAVDYSFAHKIDLKINGTTQYYKITMPIVINVNGDNGYWQGNANKIVGEIQGNCRIVKIGDNVYISHSNTNVNNKNATFICANSGVSGENGVGVYLDSISLENYSTDAMNSKTAGSLGLWTNVSRSTYKNLNINAYYGIKAQTFSCSYENIVFTCTEKALDLTTGTSNTLRFLYAPDCLNPYSLVSSYSTLMSVCCDNSKGTLFTLGGMGLSLIDCGCESPNATTIFAIANDFTTLAINNFYMYRQVGDSENNVALEDCTVLYSPVRAVVDINNFSIAEFQQLDTDNHNSYFFRTEGEGSIALATSLNNLRYYKNYSGTKNKRIRLWANRPSNQCIQRYSTPTAQFNYAVDYNLDIYPFIGGYYGADLPSDTMGGSINEDDMGACKTLWLDCKDKYHTKNGGEIRYVSQHNQGDVQFYNDPLAMNALGLSITEYVDGHTWNTNEIPIVLRGTTANRPTLNRYIGLCYFDTTLNKPIWYNGSEWKDATGTTV